MSGLKAKLKDLVDTFGYKTDRHLVVIESDDWGSTRVPSAEVLAAYRAEYPDWEPDQYQRYDCLDRYEDLQALRAVLEAHPNAAGDCARFTLNFALANPDFDAIEDSGLTTFAYEPATVTYQRSFSGKTTLDALADPGADAYFRPQLHGREHLNATKWLKNARELDAQRRAFDLRMIGTDDCEYCAMDALHVTNTDTDRVAYLAEAAELFERTFGYPSTTFIPSCYVWDPEVEDILAGIGVTSIQSGRYQKIPRGDGSLSKKVRLMGDRTRAGQTVSIRNCQFETARWRYEGMDQDACVARGIGEVAAAFDHRLPAVICSHRVNYMGAIDPANQQWGLTCLSRLLDELIRRYPDVEFLTSDQLGALLQERRS